MTRSLPAERRAVTVRGMVQGVGFRPFVYGLAHRYNLVGAVWNDTEGVRIEVEGPPELLKVFLLDLEKRAPPMAAVQGVYWRPVPARGDATFRIVPSQLAPVHHALVSPDAATCLDCLKELFDRADRRFRYPFINCTNCGPRFTITRSLPYDRSSTTMAGFTMCAACAAEYENPADRRFHAQPNACPTCGPRARVLDRDGHTVTVAALDPPGHAATLLKDGAIVAVKGLGGYHLACNALDHGAVEMLRNRKARPDKPFAVMVRDLAEARSLCRVSPVEATMLTAPSCPIVLLERRDTSLSSEIAPRQPTLGVMLAYTPLHHLLLHDAGVPLVMTSGNRSDEPIAYRDTVALEQLHDIADYFLVHDRPIHTRCDDSVMCEVHDAPYPVRRSRGMAPAPVQVVHRFTRRVLACGAELKCTFCLTRNHDAFLSPHFGDLENYQTYCSFTEGIELYAHLFEIQPDVVAHDLHPDYLSTRYALERKDGGLPAVGVQHHHAHIASCLVDNGFPTDEPVIGVALDGTGYGTDGTVWGGEFFEGSIRKGFTRRAHLAPVPLPGGASAIREPWRMAVAHLTALFLYQEGPAISLDLPIFSKVEASHLQMVEHMACRRINAPMTSSAGRLFDAVGALLGVPGALRTTYEGQAAIELELLATGASGAGYPFRLREAGDHWVVEHAEVTAAIVADLLAHIAPSEIAARFHRTVADMVVAGCLAIRRSGGPATVALSGGTFGNRLLLQTLVPLLRVNGFSPLTHRRVPANDGGLSLGQAVMADVALNSGNG